MKRVFALVSFLILLLCFSSCSPQAQGMEPTKAVHQAQGMEPTKAVHQAQGMEPTKAVHQAQGMEPTKSIHQAQSMEPTKSIYQAQSMEPTKAVPIRELIILRIATKDQPTRTAHIFSVAMNERLFNALISLPQVPASTLTRPTSSPEFQLVFKTGRDVPALIYSKEGLIHFDTNYWLSITDQFEKVFKEILAQVTFSPM